MPKKITYIAPATIILSGEFGILNSNPTLSCGLDLKITFSLWESNKKSTIIPEIKVLEKTVKDYLIAKKIDFEEKNYQYEINSEIPDRLELGYKSAYLLVILSAFYEFYTNIEIKQKEGLNTILAILKFLPDNLRQDFYDLEIAISNTFYSGFVYSRKEFEFLKNITPLDISFDKELEEQMYLIDTGKIQETNQEILEYVKLKTEGNPARFKKILNDIAKITRTLVLGLYENRQKLFLDALFRNEKENKKISSLNPKSKSILEQISNFGFAKILQPGGHSHGSGFCLFVCQKKSKSLESYLLNHNILYFKLKSSKKGLEKVQS
jgi:mevalonate kinase